MSLARFNGSVIDANGKAVPNANIEVRRSTGNRGLVVVYSDREGLVPRGNPFQSDSRGRFYFHVLGGSYRVRAYTGDSLSPTFETFWDFTPVGNTQELDADQLGQYLSAGIAPFATKTALDATTPTSGYTGAVVLNDPDPTKNGWYTYASGAWVRRRGLPDTVASLTVTGGDANNILASVGPGIDPGVVKMYYITPTFDNTGSMTINGKPLKNAFNRDLVAGEYPGGRISLLVDEGSQFRLLSDPDVAGIAESVLNAAQGVQTTAALFGDLSSAMLEIDAAVTSTSVDADSAESDALRAENARDASIVSSQTYVDIASGMAATSVNSTFDVQGSRGTAAIRYRKTGASSYVELTRYPSVVGVDQALTRTEFFETLDTTVPFVLVDSAGNIQSLLSDVTRTLFYETLDNSPLLVVVDVAGNISTRIDPPSSDLINLTTEVAQARGSRATLKDRLNQSLSLAGVPLTHLHAPGRLRRTRSLLESLRRGNPVQLDIGVPGDSWSHVTARWTGPLATRLIAEFGDGGGGWVGFGYFSGGGKNGNARDTTYTMARTGTWTDEYAANFLSPSPDICNASSSTPGSRYTVNVPASPVHSGVDLFWVGTADGVMQYRINGGAWSSINVQGGVGNLQIAPLAGIPASGPWSLEIEVVSGTCKPAGINLKSSSPGVRFHKLAASGSRAANWTGVNATQWQSGITSLGLDLIIVFLGTNDRSANVSPTSYASQLETIIQRARTASQVAGQPDVDILIAVPYQSTEILTYSIPEYVDACRIMADNNRAALLDFDYLVGSDPTKYVDWLAPDGRHPDLIYGAPALSSAFYRALTTL